MGFGLAAGCGVLLENPVATTSVDVAAIEAAAGVSSGFVMPGHILRFAAPHAELHARVREGALGQVLGIATVRDRDDADVVLARVRLEVQLSEVTGADDADAERRGHSYASPSAPSASRRGRPRGYWCMPTIWAGPSTEL